MSSTAHVLSASLAVGPAVLGRAAKESDCQGSVWCVTWVFYWVTSLVIVYPIQDGWAMVRGAVAICPLRVVSDV